MKEKIAQAIKDVLVKLALKDKLPLDMTTLDTSLFDEALQPVEELKIALADMVDNADEDCPQLSRTDHFRTAMENANNLLAEQ